MRSLRVSTWRITQVCGGALAAALLAVACRPATCPEPAPAPAETEPAPEPTPADTLARALEGCAAGDAAACTGAALRHQHGDRAPRDVDTALALHRRACELGQRRSCVHASALALRDKRYADTAGALDELLDACAGGFPTACVFLGVVTREHPLYRAASRRSRPASWDGLTRACGEGDDDACAAGLETITRCHAGERWACHVFELQRAETLERARAEGLARPLTRALEERCGPASPRACGLLAAVSTFSMSLDERACGWGYGESCTRLAALERVNAEQLDRAEIRAACERGEPEMCKRDARTRWQLGEPERARELYERVCDLGDAAACESVARTIDVDAFGPRADERAGFLTRACRLRGAPDCDALTELRGELALAACTSKQRDHCYEAFDALRDEDPERAGELLRGLLRDKARVCKTSSTACETVQWLIRQTGCGRDGLQRCAAGSVEHKRQARRAATLDAARDGARRRECAKGVALSCRELGGDALDRSLQEAERYYARACELGDPLGCDQAWSVADGYREVSEAERLGYQDKACAAGDAGACHHVAGKIATRDPQRAAELVARAKELATGGCAGSRELRGEACEGPHVIKLLVALELYTSVEPTLRRLCHGTSQRGCRELVDLLRPLRGSWT